jgi:hypothetical protein
MKDKAKLLRKRSDLSKDSVDLDGSLVTLESRRKHRCVWIRNQYIKRRIQMDFGRRQRKLTRLSRHDSQKYDGSVEVLPVSAIAFRDLLKKKKPMPGFPSKSYTGIPTLRQWMEKAVFAYREDHLDSILRGLQRLYDGIRCWSDDKSRGKVHFSRREIEALLQYSHDKYRNVSEISRQNDQGTTG